MKRQRHYTPTAPPEEVYYLPTAPLSSSHYSSTAWLPPTNKPPSSRRCGVVQSSLPHSQPPSSSWKCVNTPIPIFPNPNQQIRNISSDYNYEMIDEPRNILHTTRFNVKSSKPRKKLNPQLNTKRGCTDVIFCFLFLLFTIGWGFVAAIGFLWGDAERLILPTDTTGRRCGGSREKSYNLTNQPYLYYFDITKCISYSTALGGCQTPQWVDVNNLFFNEYHIKIRLKSFVSFFSIVKMMTSLYCIDEVDKNSITSFSVLRNYVQQQKCASYTVKSAPVLGRCVPEILIGAVDKVNDLQQKNSSLDTLKVLFGDDGTIPPDKAVNDSEKYIGQFVDSEGIITKIIHDLSKSWWQILTLIGGAGILAFIWIAVLRILGGFMIWMSIFCIVGILVTGCGFSWYKWTTLVNAGAIDDFSFQPIFSVYFEMPTTWLVVAIIVSIALLILLLVLLFVRKRISIAVALIEESSRAVGHMMSTLLFPVFPFLLHILASVIALWGTIAIWLASSGVEKCQKNDGQNTTCNCSTTVQDSSCVFVGLVKEETTIFWLQLYNLFAFFWMTCFVSSLGDISLAGAFASYYWARNKPKDVPSFPVLRALTRAVRYNMGSLAFGSLIIATTKIIRVILEYLDRKLSKTNSSILKTILSALKCCFWCMEVFLKFLTKNAFIMMAIYGKNFFTSAKDSFQLLVRNCVRAAVVNQVAGILLFIGKALISLGIGVVAYFYFSGQWIVDGIPRVDLYYYFVPIILVLIGSYFVTDLFFNVYEMAVDTTFICFLEDSEQNDGSVEKPFYMSKNLQRLLNTENEK
ncbi:hypothetical protein DICVIV_12108 [Dictyocaulus viviparus]|uniref:Choline transporter-like protein n=1 Tax=Dictyocaulus viviparus TaxID=29172 RepID=A0A0D8XBD4_DICVI|nr:hypothetical protein DICVIV_12108 [Dictyocaulus viviparus]